MISLILVTTSYLDFIWWILTRNFNNIFLKEGQIEKGASSAILHHIVNDYGAKEATRYLNDLQKIIKEVLTEKKKKRDRCLKIADRKFDKPSAYKSGAVVRCRKGDIWKGVKEAVVDQLTEDESLRKWFKRSGPSGKQGGWVDCNTGRKDSKTGKMKYKACGRAKGEKRAKYPSCRPTPSKCKDKGKGKSWGKTK